MESSINHISEGVGVPLVFQHGLTANVNQTSSLLSGLPGIRLMSIDCPGHGLSKLPDDYVPGFNNYADEVIKFLDQQRVDQAIFGGISMGSGIAVNIALRYPDRVTALILVRPAWLNQSNPENLKILLPAAGLINKADAEARFRQLNEFREIDLPAVAQSILGVFAPDQQSGLGRVIKQMVGDRPFDSIDQLTDIASPCLVVGNDQDPLHPYHMAEKIHQTIRGSVLTKLTSRYIDNDLHVKQVRRAIVDFIEDNKLYL